MKTKIIFISLFLSLVIKGYAQSDFKRFTISTSAENVLNKGWKYSWGADYIFPIKGINNIGIGAYYALAKHSLDSEEFFYSCDIVDDENENFIYKAHGKDIKENQTIHFIEIPIYYQLRIKSFFFNIGPKIAIPIKSEYNMTKGNVELTGYYPKYNVELTDLPNHGFANYNIEGEKGNLDTQIACGANVGIGYCLSVGSIDLNLKAFAEYMFNDYVAKGKNYLEYPGNINSYSYACERSGHFSLGFSLSIGF